MPGPLPFEEGRSVTKLPPWARSLFMEIEISGDVSCHSLSLNVAHEHLTLAEKGVGVGGLHHSSWEVQLSLSRVTFIYTARLKTTGADPKGFWSRQIHS